MTRFSSLCAVGFVLTLASAGCTLIGGAQGGMADTSSIADAPSVAKEEPKGIAALRDLRDSLIERLEKHESDPNEGGRRRESSIGSVRTSLTSLHRGIVYGGTFANIAGKECKDCKAHPTWFKLRDEYPDLQARMDKLEADEKDCTYGFQVSDGTIVRPDSTWSVEQLEKTQKSSKHEVARCWSNTDSENYN